MMWLSDSRSRICITLFEQATAAPTALVTAVALASAPAPTQTATYVFIVETSVIMLNNKHPQIYMIFIGIFAPTYPIRMQQ